NATRWTAIADRPIEPDSSCSGRRMRRHIGPTSEIRDDCAITPVAFDDVGSTPLPCETALAPARQRSTALTYHRAARAAFLVPARRPQNALLFPKKQC